jgi:glutaconyl-CoA/methylmalonyl-CoA decarboxylase subunit gamma
MKKLRVTVEGKAYEVLVEILDEGSHAAVPAHAPAPVVTPAASVATPAAAPAAPAHTPKGHAGAGDVLSPLAGKVVSIDVKMGQAVKEGAQVATLEAMKMNTYIYAPKAGRVDAVMVNAGDAVEEGTALLRLV